MKTLPGLFLIFCFGLLFNCTSTKNTDQPENLGAKTTTADAAHNSQNALDWAGTYRGVLPCADCAGIRTELQLHQDLTYELTRHYQEKESGIIRSAGTFKWDETGSTITLMNANPPSAPNQYKVGENVLWQLDENGQKITGQLAEMYALKKAGSDNAITDKYWKLIELRGQPVIAPENPKREPHFTLQPENNRVTGMGGCNTFTGTYTLQEGNRIKFGPLAATRMACPDMTYENDLFQAFDAADNFSLKGDTLSLNKARMAPLARFVEVYIRK